MTTRIEAQQAINTAFEAAWTVSPGVFHTPYTVDNVDLEAEEEWAYATIEDGPSRQHTLGPVAGRKFERMGTFIVYIRTERNEGTNRGDVLAALVTAAFEAKRIGEVIFQAASPQRSRTRGRWYEVAVRVPFLYYDRK